MKKFFRYLLVVIGILVLAVAGFATFVALRGIPKYKAEKIELKIEPTAARVQRGEIIVNALCSNCHLNRQTNKLSGKEMDDVPEFGKIFSKNITHDPEHGIGKWTDGEIVYLLRTGLKPDGTYLPPYMAKLPHMSDEDIASIISFLRSDNPMVAADTTVQPATQPSFLTKVLCNVGIAKPFSYPQGPIPQPDTNNAVALGRYVAFNFDCFSCHSADFKTNDFLNPEKSDGYFGGGIEFRMPDGSTRKSLNLTADTETGIGKWSETDFVKAVRTGIPPGGGPLREPMMPYPGLSEKEVKAIFAYLKTIPKINHRVERNNQ